MRGKCTVCKKQIDEWHELCRECFERLEPVRVGSASGPCLQFYRRVRNNRTSVTVAFPDGDGFTVTHVGKLIVHTEPCSCCTDHPKTQYPDGYMD